MTKWTKHIDFSVKFQIFFWKSLIHRKFEHSGFAAACWCLSSVTQNSYTSAHSYNKLKTENYSDEIINYLLSRTYHSFHIVGAFHSTQNVMVINNLFDLDGRHLRRRHCAAMSSGDWLPVVLRPRLGVGLGDGHGTEGGGVTGRQSRDDDQRTIQWCQLHLFTPLLYSQIIYTCTILLRVSQ